MFTRSTPWIETCEPRRLMSVDAEGAMAAAESEPEAAMLLPAIQMAREARRPQGVAGEYLLTFEGIDGTL